MLSKATDKVFLALSYPCLTGVIMRVLFRSIYSVTGLLKLL